MSCLMTVSVLVYVEVELVSSVCCMCASVVAVCALSEGV